MFCIIIYCFISGCCQFEMNRHSCFLNTQTQWKQYY
nr:MAG TPA: hypothetical protein [Caudoviricetes sp.]